MSINYGLTENDLAEIDGHLKAIRKMAKGEVLDERNFHCDVVDMERRIARLREIIGSDDE